jgi:hypothetical protein
MAIIAHPPCAQWARLRHFAHSDIKEKNLAIFCYEKILIEGGILEHPFASSLWKYLGIEKKIINTDLHSFGFKALKKTSLYFHNCKPLAFPLCFDAITTTVDKMSYTSRSITPVKFNEFLVSSIRETHPAYKNGQIN